ncbi:flippase [Notoacmeibacter marinus]|uniref:flippase n=1 Tax=Notoacmeibacter marinus TaxID=1876515 RepID=UPI000DF22451|nr:flippase [Notoacmeibacter marinus]
MNKPITLRRTVTDIALTFGRQFLAGLMQLGQVLIVARLLGPEGAGIYAVALLTPTLMGQLLNFGLPSANVYFVASRKVSATEAWAASRDLIVCLIVLGLVIASLVLAFAGFRLFPGVPLPVLFAALAIFPFSLPMTIATGFFQAVQDFRSFNMAVLVQPVLALSGMIVLWLTGTVDLTTIVAMVSMTHALALLFTLYRLNRDIDILTSGKGRAKYLRCALPYGAKSHLGNILSFLNYRIDIFLVNLIVGPAATGLYTIAVRLTEQLWMISQAVSTVIFPRLASMADDSAARGQFTSFMARIVLWITLAASGVLAAVAQPLIAILFGADFLGATAALLVLLPGIALFSCARVLANDLAARGFAGINLALALVTLAVNTAANLILIPRFGIVGAAAATTLSYTLVLLVRLIIGAAMDKTSWWMNLVPMPDDFRLFRRFLGGLKTR